MAKIRFLICMAEKVLKITKTVNKNVGSNTPGPSFSTTKPLGRVSFRDAIETKEESREKKIKKSFFFCFSLMKHDMKLPSLF